MLLQLKKMCKEGAYWGNYELYLMFVINKIMQFCLVNAYVDFILQNEKSY